jgi:hypothetical protein
MNMTTRALSDCVKSSFPRKRNLGQATNRAPWTPAFAGATDRAPRIHRPLPLQSNGDDQMTLPPGRFDYAPINDRPVIKR